MPSPLPPETTLVVALVLLGQDRRACVVVIGEHADYRVGRGGDVDGLCCGNPDPFRWASFSMVCD